ncbi:MAG: exosortase/archaeosortase family protein [Bacteroidia bacterium]|nr:exosortase/archaeosortase family protein [Bacteroidia bacterium]
MNKAGVFLIRFIITYLGLNAIYQVLVQVAAPNPDAFTKLVAQLSSALSPGTSLYSAEGFNKIQVIYQGKALVNILEGCNGMAVWITLLAFVVAFKGKNKDYLWFLPLSFFLLQAGNILRLIVLIRIKIAFPHWFDLFHTYVFPAALYAVAFGLMVWWTQLIKQNKA